jgi:chemotaxis protein MotA
LIVFCGTLAVTAISFTGAEFFNTVKIIGKSLVRHIYNHKSSSHQLIDLAVAVRHDGVLSLQQIEKELKKDNFLYRGIQMVSDGNTSDEISRIMGQEIDAQAARHHKGISILRRAAETAPAMGLIGTLIGLVQMLAMLDDPSTIGPSMAVALLTTFYGAMLGTVVCSPLAGKLEANAEQEILHKTLILTTLGSIARQENPRRLEMMLNSELPPSQRVKYFK